MKKLYYVVEKNLQSVGEVEETTGHKTIFMYEITSKNEIHLIDTAECLIEDNTEKVIQDYLDNSGKSDKYFEELIQL